MGLLEELKRYLETTPREEVLKTWAKSKKYDKVGPTVDEFMHMQKFARKHFPFEAPKLKFATIKVTTIKSKEASVCNAKKKFNEEIEYYLGC